jgi:anti-sigma-K factor RskA
VNIPVRDDIHLLAGAYALDALDGLETRRFEQHLVACSSCREDVASFATVSGTLAIAASETPPPGLRAAVLQAVDQTRQAPAVASKRSGYPRQFPALFAVLSAAACAVFALLLVGQSRASSRLSAKASVVEAVDARTSQLVGGGGGGGGGGQIRLTYSVQEGASVLLADGLAPPPEGRVYELWFISNGEPQRAATFKTDASQHASLRVGRAPVAGSVIAITVEPAGGSDAPSSAPTFQSQPT